MCLSQHSNAAPAEVHGVPDSRSRRQLLSIIWSRWRAANADLNVRRVTLGEENDTTGHTSMTLPKRKVTVRVTDRSCQPVIRAANNLKIVARLGREGQALRGLEIQLV